MTLERRDSGLSPQNFPAPKGLLKITRHDWVTFWRSPQARLVVEADVPALERLFRLRDERERVRRDLKRTGYQSKGYNKQPAVSPAIRYLAHLDDEIHHLEDRFGLTPRSRLALGIALNTARTSLADLHNALEADDD